MVSHNCAFVGKVWAQRWTGVSAFHCFCPSPAPPEHLHGFLPRVLRHVSAWDGIEEMRSNGARRGDWENGIIHWGTERKFAICWLAWALWTSAYDCADVCWGQRRASFTETTEAALCFVWFRCISFFFSDPGAPSVGSHCSWWLPSQSSGIPGDWCQHVRWSVWECVSPCVRWRAHTEKQKVI